MPIRHADELREIAAKQEVALEALVELSDAIHALAMKEGMRNAAGRALSAPYLSLGELSSITRDVRKVIPVTPLSVDDSRVEPNVEGG